MEHFITITETILPIEYPKVFNINIPELQNASKDVYMGYTDFSNKIEYETHNGPLLTLIDQIKNFYNSFLNSIQKSNRKLLPSYKDILDILEDIRKTAREGDIIEIELGISFAFYISGYGKDRIALIIRNFGEILPKEAINAIKYYNIHELKDFQRLYKIKNITQIMIPRKYYPKELTKTKEDEIPFEIKNKENYSLLLDIGDKKEYILYSSIPRK